MFDYAVLILIVYITFGILCACLFHFFGMSIFDAICHAMTTVSSGGFSNYDSSFLHFMNSSLEYIAIVFMILAAVPFVVIIRLFTRRKLIFGSQAMVMICMIIMTTLLLFGVYSYQETHTLSSKSFRDMLFAVSSIISSTGFSSSELMSYGDFFVILLSIVGIVGGCTGSTAGGLKVFRFQVIYHMVKYHFRRTIYPSVVVKIHCDDQDITSDTMMTVVVLITLYAIFAFASILTITAHGFSLSHAIASTVTAISNSGIIVSEYGTSNSILSQYPQFIHGMLGVLMLLGRLEFITVLVIIAKILRRA